MAETKKSKGKVKITHEQEKCIGCGACAAICAERWEMNDSGKSDIKGGKQVGKNQTIELDSMSCNKEAAESCPVNCIHIEENGKKVV